MFSFDELKNIVPQNKRNTVTQELVDKINDIASDDLVDEEFKSNILTHKTILSSGKWSMSEYIDAVRFVTLVLLGHTDIDAYAIVFPDRYKRLFVDKKLSRTKISPYVTAYKNNSIVVAIIEQTLVPTHILNLSVYQEAINHSKYLMLNAKSETVQQKAAETLLTQLKAPEAAKLEVDISINKGSVVDDYEQVMRDLATQKLELIKYGGDVKTIANISPIQQEEIIDVEEEKV